MGFSYGNGTNPHIDQPRFMIADTDSTHAIFSDEEVQMAYDVDVVQAYIPNNQGALLPIKGSVSSRRAAANLLLALAGNKARLSAALKVLDINVDSTKAAVELRATAKEWRDVEANSGNFAITEMVQDQ